MRSIGEIESIIIEEKSNHSQLDDLNSESKVSIWRLWVFLVSFAIHVFEGLQDAFKDEVVLIQENSKIGSLRWYKYIVLDWQYDHELEWVGYRFGYVLDDSGARLVSQAVAVSNGRKLIVKVAKGEVGALEPLSASEYDSLKAYLEEVKIAGTDITLISELADSLKLYFNVYYDPIKSQSTVSADVELIIENYIQNLPFNGQLKLSLLVNEIQDISGVVDVVFTDAYGRYGNLAYNQFDRVYLPNAGYMEIDEAFPLNTTITYLTE